MANEWTTAEKTAAAMAVGSVVLGLGAVLVHFFGRRRTAVIEGAGDETKRASILERRKVGGMTMTLYADPVMPLDMRVRIIQDLTAEGTKDPQIQALAAAIVGAGRRRVQIGKYVYDVVGANCGNNADCRADAIGRWTAANIRYTGDIAPVKAGRHGQVEGVDLFQSPRRTVEIGGGDCDDSTSLTCSMNEIVGVPCQHRVTAPRDNADWQHIYPVANVGGRELVLDATLPGQYRTGREAPYAKRREFRSY